MERVRLSQPTVMYWRMDVRPATGFFCSWARAPSGQASRIRRKIRGKESLRLFMADGSQHHNADGRFAQWNDSAKGIRGRDPTTGREPTVPIPPYCPFTVHDPKEPEQHPGTGETKRNAAEFHLHRMNTGELR